jgi:betaine-aldehyde dehydrogenase
MTSADATGTRREQLIEMTIDSLAEVGYVESTLTRIGKRAGVSAGLVAHYFDDKDGLLEATFRTLLARLGRRVRARLAQAHTPRGRVQAIIDANLAAEEFDRRTGAAWLAFWGQVPHVERLRRVQHVYQRRMLSNLRHALRALLDVEEARSLAAMIAAMIDGVWLRAALSDWTEADSEGARTLLATFLDYRLKPQGAVVPGPVTRVARRRVTDGSVLISINPATGKELARLAVAGAYEVDAAVSRASDAQRVWAARTGAER